jgi:hypothetical protein
MQVRTKTLLGHTRKNNIKIYLAAMGCESVGWSESSNIIKKESFVMTETKLRVP